MAVSFYKNIIHNYFHKLSKNAEKKKQIEKRKPFKYERFFKFPL